MRFEPRPVRRPRIPVWVAGSWPHRSAFRRAARWDGVFPASRVTDESGAPIPLDELRAVLDVIRDARGDPALSGYDVVVTGGTPAEADEAWTIVAPYARAGATWWCEGINAWRGPLEEMEARVRAGPPRAPVG